MKKLILGVIAVLAIAAPAAAADLSPRTYTKAPAAELAYNWSGFYAGLNAGYGWGASDPSTTTEFTPTNYWSILSVPQVNAAGTGQVKPSGFVGGAQAGYNFQAGNLVVGAEADFESFNLHASRAAGAAFACCGGSSFTMTESASTDWLFTLRGRVGLAANNWLFYGTGGLAVTNLKNNATYADTFGASENVKLSATKAGWAAGGGIEYGVLRNWTLRAEYLHVDFGGISGTTLLGPTTITGGCNCTRMFHNANLTADMVRAGINYRFD